MTHILFGTERGSCDVAVDNIASATRQLRQSLMIVLGATQLGVAGRHDTAKTKPCLKSRCAGLAH